MHIGSRIRYYRLLKELTPEELVEGITTVSYLTSLESNAQTPPIEMLSQLCDRLEIPFMTYPNEELSLLIQDWKHSLLLNNKAKSSLIFDDIQTKVTNRDDLNLIFTYKIYSIRYHILVNQLEKAHETIEELKPFLFEMPDNLKFSFQKFYGNYLYCCDNYIEASSVFNNAKNYLFSIETFNNEEKADLYYMYGLTLGRITKNTLCIFYMEEALSLFQKSYQMSRCTDCHMMLGAIYSRMQDYDEAEKHYKIAKELAITLEYSSLIDKIEHNLGILKSRQGKSSEAIEHFLSSWNEDNTSKSDDQLQIILSIVKEYYKIGFVHEVKKWLEHGFELVQSGDNHKNQFIELTFYKYIVDGYRDGFDKFVLEEAIPYYESIKKFEQIVLFSKTLGEYYQKKQLYKEAATSFAIANSAYEEIIKL